MGQARCGLALGRPKPRTPSATFVSVPTGGLLQRKCACGGSPGLSGKCEACSENRLLQRRSAQPTVTPAVPRTVHEVLRSPGRPLDAATRSIMEPRFGHDFSKVRVHTDAQAAESARAVDALAYTVGHDIVFGAGEHAGATSGGGRLMAHELTHVLQQQHFPPASSAEKIMPAQDPSEREADDIADRITRGESAAPVRREPDSSLMRKLKVDRPAEPIPNPDGRGLKQTNAETVEGYLRNLSPDGGVTVNRASGEVDMATGYCPGFLGGLLQGAASGARKGGRTGIPVLGVLIGGLVGGIVGAFQGLFSKTFSGSDTPSRAASSKTPTGSTCLCDFVHGSTLWTIEVNDEESPETGRRWVRTVSPNSRKLWGAATVSGKLQNFEPWVILGHELCGHAWLDERHETELGGQFGTWETLPEDFLRHGRTVERENELRKEHGIEARGYKAEDPYCGESFWRDRMAQDGEPHWQPNLKGSKYQTYLEECQFLRDQLPQSKVRKYRIDERIP